MCTVLELLGVENYKTNNNNYYDKSAIRHVLPLCDCHCIENICLPIFDA